MEEDEVGVRHVRKLVPRFCHDKSVNMRPNNTVFAGDTLKKAWTNSLAMYRRKASSPQPTQWKERKRGRRRKLYQRA